MVSSPDSPTLAAAVALAAGRFQPLLRWETEKHRADILTTDEARALSLNLETKIADLIPHYDKLGDDCDFVALAGDYPYRYDAKGVNAFDDLILRAPDGLRRWAYAGRLNGDLTRGVYQAMCSLFLHPSSALLFNGYSQKERPWTEYGMDAAFNRLSAVVKAGLRNGERASFPGWHQAFDPSNPYGLLLINTSGTATAFNLDGGPGQTADVPESVPTAVLIIHSLFCRIARRPRHDCRPLDGQRRLRLLRVGQRALSPGVPPARPGRVVPRREPPGGHRRSKGPGRARRPTLALLYLGDPLYRIKGRGNSTARLATWAPVSTWPAYGEFQQPGPEEPEDLRLKWALKTAIFMTQTAATRQQRVDLPETLLGIARDRLGPALRPLYDDLLVDTLVHSNRPVELIDRLRRIPPAERSPALRRHLETAQTAALQRAVSARNLRQAMSLWGDVIRAPGSRDFARVFTDRVGRLADESASRLADWRARLNNALRADPDPANLPVIQAELRRVTDKAAAGTAR